MARRRDNPGNVFIGLLFCFTTLVSSTISRPKSSDPTTFTFDIHHRFSDKITNLLPSDNLPEIGSLQYYAYMAGRDRALHRRKLADPNTPLTFVDGNETYLLTKLAFLYYAFVSVGSPNLSYMVALDTGSDIFWLPCECESCRRSFETSSGKSVKFNIYSPSLSSTSRVIPCSSKLCDQQLPCNSSDTYCPYSSEYLQANTSTSGYLVEDDLQLITGDAQTQVVGRIIVGCGTLETGSFLENNAPNGLLGLGLEAVSVPSILASQGLIANSFSLCFGNGTSGRITLGDKGSSTQSEAPINDFPDFPSYNITVASVSVGGGDPVDVGLEVIFDTGTSFTQFNSLAFSAIAERYDQLVSYTRFQGQISGLDFQYCYDIRPYETASFPSLEFTMGNGAVFMVKNPIEALDLQDGYTVFCLGLFGSDDADLIGQNFMRGYRVVFDKERMILGWEQKDCYNLEENSSSPTSPTGSEIPPTENAPPPSNSPADIAPPPSNIPTDTAPPPSNSPTDNAPPPSYNPTDNAPPPRSSRTAKPPLSSNSPTSKAPLSSNSPTTATPAVVLPRSDSPILLSASSLLIKGFIFYVIAVC